MDNFLLNFKEKLNINDEIMKIIMNIILTENIEYKKENFKIFINKNFGENKINENNYLFCSLLLYLLDIQREFKYDLIKNNLKEKFSEFNEIIPNFIKILDLNILNKNIPNLKFKISIINNLYELNSKNLNNENQIIIFNIFFDFIENEDFSFLLSNFNDEIGMVLSYFLNSMNHLINQIVNNNKNNYEKIKEKINKIIEIIKNNIFKDFLQFYIKIKNFIFLLLNLYFNLLRIFYKEDSNNFISNSKEFISQYYLKKNYEILLIIIKAFANNCNEDFLFNMKIDCLDNFIKDKFLNFNNNKFPKNYFEFYLNFIKFDLNGKFSLLINDLFLLLLNKIKSENEINSLEKQLINNNFILNYLIKINKEKENFGFIEENFFDILNFLNTKCKNLKNEISSKCFDYIVNLINSKNRPLLNESNLFSFISSKEKNIEIRVNFLKFILSFSFEKKDIGIIQEFSKKFFDYFKKNNSEKFKENYSIYLINYLFKLNPKNLRNLNNFFISIEKLSTEFYIQIVEKCYELITLNLSKNNLNDVYILFNIFFSLLRPFKTQKKILFIENNFLRLKYEKLKIDIKIELEIIKNIVITNNLSLTLCIIDFINVFENHNAIFPIIFTVLKYNIKSENTEFKASVTKSFQIYFNSFNNQIIKIMNKINEKSKNEEIFYIKNAFDNLKKLLLFINDNIYIRPIENLQTFLDVLLFLIEFIENLEKKCLNVHEKIKIIFKEFLNDYKKIIFNKNFCKSLISLLNNTFYFIRINAFKILKNKNFVEIFREIKNDLILEIENYYFSLRQMDCEGSSYLFIILINHLNKEFLFEIMKKIFNFELNDNNNNNENLINLSLKFFQNLIKNKQEEYLNYLNKNEKENFNIKKNSIHYFFVYIKNILELEKETILLNSQQETLNLLFNLINDIISLNKKIVDFLINNGVSEFSIENDNNNNNNEFELNDHENKLLISLWNTSKFSIKSLYLIYEILQTNYQIIISSLKKNAEKNLILNLFLNPLKNSLNEIIPIIINSKHMGVVKSMSECLFKNLVLLNKSTEPFSNFSLISKEILFDFIQNQLQNHEISSILRRSAGIPYLICTLMKSYINSNFSDKFINEILDFCIEDLLNNFNKFQEKNIDASVHCLHILRIICDDTLIKFYARNFYSKIIMNILNGLQSENWSIKNACMLMFSRIIKNSFLMYNESEMERILPTFNEYFLDKKKFKESVFNILENNVNSDNNNLNDCVFLFITLFNKFRLSKPNEFLDEDLNKIIELLFKFDKKNNKLFRKLLTNAILKLIGKNYEKLIKNVKFGLENVENNNLLEIYQNKMDFYYNIINEIIKNENIENKNKFDLILFYFKKIQINKNFFVLTKFNQLLKKFDEKFINENFNNFIEIFDYFEIGINIKNKEINLNLIFLNLIKNNRIFSYNKFIKHSLDLFLKKLNFILIFSEQNFFAYFNNKKCEEIIIFLFKKFPNKINLNMISPLKNLNLTELNLNISTKIIKFISNLKILSILNVDEKNFLFNEIIIIFQTQNQKTKLIKKLFNLIPLIIEINNIEKINKILEIIEKFCLSDNLNKIRFASNLCFEILIKNIDSNLNNLNNFLILKIFYLFLNDENPTIRMKTSEIFIIYNKKYNLIKFKNEIKYVYTNEYLLKQLLINGNRKIDYYNNFLALIKNNNFYFRTNSLDTKVFYFEPDNRYIDNIQSKIFVYKNELKNNCKIEEKEKKILKFDNIKIMNIIEEFSDNIINVIYILNNNNNINQKNNNKYLFKDQIRNILYK